MRIHRPFFLPLTLLALGACSDDGDLSDGDDNSPPEAAAYALANTVSTADTPTTYVHILSSLDDGKKIGSSGGLEYAGYATVAAQGGALLIASAESPTIQRFSVSENLKLTQTGDEVDFSDYGLANAGLFANVFVNNEKAYMNQAQIGRVIWNPEDMTIEGEGPASGIEENEYGLKSFAAYDRGIAVSGGRVYQPFYFADDMFYKVAPQSKIVIYGEDDAVEETLEVDCPALDTVTKDERGNLYFSIWAGTISYRLTADDAPKSCVARIDSGKTEVKETFRIEDLTDGRETSMYRYMKDGVGTVAVFDTDGLDLDAVDDPATLNRAANWELWRVNLEEKTAEPIEGLPKFSGGYYSFTIDGRTLVLLPSADLATTTIFEVKTTGEAEKLFETTGWTYQLTKIR